MRRRAILFGLVTALAIAVGFFAFRSNPLQAIGLVKQYGYWQILGVTILFGACFWRSLRSELRETASKYRAWVAPLALIVAAGAYLQVEEPHEFKIVMDEVVLQGTAMRMHFNREVSVTTRAYDLAGVFSATGPVYVDKRPLLFPFLLSTVHDLTGYRISNVYFLNAVISTVFLGLLYLIGRRLSGPAAGTVGVLLAISIPLVHQNAVGSGFEMLNLAMIASTIWLGMRWSERPEDTDRLGAFVFSGILLAQTRYESALFIAPVGLVILLSWWRRRAADFAWPILVAPLCLVIIPLHFNIFKLAPAAWQLADVSEAQTPFSGRFFYDNIGHALNFFLSFDGAQGSSPLVFILGMFAIGFSVVVLYRDHRTLFTARPAEGVFLIFMIGLGLQTLVMLLYFWGWFDDPVIRRLSLPSNLLLVLATVYALPKLISHPARWRWMTAGTLIYIVAFTAPSVALHRYSQENFAARTNSWMSDFIDKLGDESTLAIDGTSGLQWLIHQKSTVAPDSVMARPEAYVFHFKNTSFKNFLLVQRMGIDFANNAMFSSVDDDFEGALTLEPLAERAFSPVYRIRISRVTAVDEEKLKAWIEHRKTAIKITPAIKSVVKKTEDQSIRLWYDLLP